MGQVGLGTTGFSVLTPSSVSLSAGAVMVDGGSRRLVVLSDGTVWSWGANDTGQLGDGTTTSHSAPAAMSGLSSITRVAGGFDHGLAVAGDGTLWAWGDNTFGQVGDGTTSDRLSPVQVSESGFSWKTSTPVLNPGTSIRTAVTKSRSRRHQPGR